MPRVARFVADGVPHHVTQRGNARQQVFRRPEDYALYEDLLQRYAQRSGLALWAYCLMPNHIHLVCVPEHQRSLATALGRTHADFAKHFNIVGRSCGHVWQARFFSCPLDGPHTWQAMAYVERNPVRAGLVADAADYRWSSASQHCRPDLARLDLARPAADSRARPVLDLQAWESQYDASRWIEVLRTSIDEEALAERIRQATLRGRPLGSKSFIHFLEESSGRRLQPRPPGRPGREAAMADTCGHEQMLFQMEG